MLGGTLTLESEEGKGSDFRFRVPMEVGRAKEFAADETADDMPERFFGRVLLVDDQPSNRMFLRIVLEQFGLECVEAVDGADAVERFGKDSFDLVLMDENMPRLDGVGALREILRLEKKRGMEHTPVVSVTANALQGDREHFLQEGFDDYVGKPVTPEKLHNILHRFMEHGDS